MHSLLSNLDPDQTFKLQYGNPVYHFDLYRLSDPEEFVVTGCITAMLRLTSLGLLQKVALYELLKETTAFLVHPNLWIRQATAGFISAAAEQLDPIDVVVKLGAIVAPFLQKEVIQLNRPYLILNNVQTPIPRKVYESVVLFGDDQYIAKY